MLIVSTQFSSAETLLICSLHWKLSSTDAASPQITISLAREDCDRKDSNMFPSLNVRVLMLKFSLQKWNVQERGREITSRKRHLPSESWFTLLRPCLTQKENPPADLRVSGAALSPGCKHKACAIRLDQKTVPSSEGTLISDLGSEHLLRSSYLYNLVSRPL